ncbi:DMSO reductase anchor subunit [Desulfitobacterium dichloroeliminans LMG P-21439]|uniref:DMSO reductase anchor subunit n=1 Tax=Desulfitobacterium dichloroeliminans (strain LMG P-21439 / DCA1) TaxID=871963 RepID=L0F6G2_DESDL|nr:DmsC/YnfH family molybdoenzyme membrane anchor subunit [Desulfitobacterium dichloroeliminans]AGA68523.1 DMSO reductase anchor subunit [Desulfitobacterium dichloroeliminans LMG P-21439]
MANGEWALIIFSILTQCAVGIWVVAIGLRTFTKRAEPNIIAQLTWRSLLVVGPLMCIALVISIFHLGSPMQAYASVANLLTSWLSREIVFSGLFLFFWVISILVYRRGASSMTLGWVTSFFGLIAVFSMSSIYYTTPISAWASPNTYISFFATMIILGSLACTMFMDTIKDFTAHQGVRTLLWRLSLFTMGVLLVQGVFFIVSSEVYSFFPVLYCTFLFIGGITFLVYGFQGHKNPGKGLRPVFYLSLVLLFSAQILGRYLFYSSAASIMS